MEKRRLTSTFGFLLITLLVGAFGVFAIIASGGNFSVAQFFAGIAGGEAKGGVFEARFHSTAFQPGSSNAEGETFTAFIGSFNAVVVEFSDSDADGIFDGVDTLLGNAGSLITTGVASPNMNLAGNIANGTFSGVQEVNISDGSISMISFFHNFSQSSLNVSRMQVHKTATSMLVIFDGQLQPDRSKTVIVDDPGFISLCVKDSPITSISEISSACNLAGEISFTSCLSANASISGISCTDLGSSIRVDNLTHSGIVGILQSSSEGTSGGGSGRRYPLNVYPTGQCLGKPISLIIASLNNRSLQFAEVSLFEGNTTANSKKIQNYLLYPVTIEFTLSLVTSLNITKNGTYTILVESPGYSDVQYTFDLAACPEKIKVTMELENETKKESISEKPILEELAVERQAEDVESSSRWKQMLKIRENKTCMLLGFNFGKFLVCWYWWAGIMLFVLFFSIFTYTHKKSKRGKILKKFLER